VKLGIAPRDIDTALPERGVEVANQFKSPTSRPGSFTPSPSDGISIQFHALEDETFVVVIDSGLVHCEVSGIRKSELLEGISSWAAHAVELEALVMRPTRVEVRITP